jgi:hypothetical protein
MCSILILALKRVHKALKTHADNGHKRDGDDSVDDCGVALHGSVLVWGAVPPLFDATIYPIVGECQVEYPNSYILKEYAKCTYIPILRHSVSH